MTTQLRFRPGRRRGRAVPRDPAEGERASTLFNSAHDADDVPQRLLTPGTVSYTHLTLPTIYSV